jgi:cytochrome c
MKTLASIAALFALLLAGVPARAQNNSHDPVAHGHALAKEFCAKCHAIGKTGKSPHEEAPPFRKFSQTFDLDHFPGAQIHGLSSNHPDMPQFDLTTQDARDLRDYLRTVQE